MAPDAGESTQCSTICRDAGGVAALPPHISSHQALLTTLLTIPLIFHAARSCD